MENLRVPITNIEFKPPVYYCKRATKEFTLDGNLDKEFWYDADFTDYFLDIEGDIKPKPRFKTRAKMLWDDKNFYFGAVLEGDEIWANLTERDCVIFYDNDFEIFIDPDSDTHRYFEFEMNALNTVWDLFLTKPYRDKGGNPLNGWDIKGLKTAVHIDGELNNPSANNKKWSVEIVMPFEALAEMSITKQTPKVGEYYRVNFSRVQWKVDVVDNKYVKQTDENGKSLPEDNWVWAPTGLINIHYPELWGFVFFTENGEKYDIPQCEYTKWELRKLYYYQHRYFDRYGKFTDNITDLISEDKIKILPTIQITDNSFEMSAVTSDSKERVVIYSDGMTEVLENKKKIPFNLTNKCNEEELKYLEFLYNHSPQSDFVVVDDEFLLNVVKHCIMVKNEYKWYDNLSEELFLNYVLLYRVNNENPVFYHKIIYDQVKDIIKGKSLKEAIIELNYWCLQKATYQSTNQRTASAITIMNNAYGRCGEESTFTVSVLRSVGIPARQCYAPRWSHCDDNHAWVEVWTGQKWEYLGACEPEMELNSGWFTIPASKAMLVHTNTYLNNDLKECELTKNNDKIELNVLEHYAKTKDFTVLVLDENNTPLKDAVVNFEVVNYSEFYPIAKLKTDANGKVLFKTGLGDIIITVSKNNVICTTKVSVAENDEVTVILKEETPKNYFFEFYPPKGLLENDIKKSDHIIDIEKQKSEKAVKIREEFVNTFENEESAKEFESKNNLNGVSKFLINARANHKVIKQFLINSPDKSLAVRILNTLTQKDLSDITLDILNDHLQYALKYKSKENDKYFDDIISPRICDEMIYAYKSAIYSDLPNNVKKLILTNPKYAIIWVNSNILNINEKYELSPLVLIKTKLGNDISKKILTVGILRTLGIPAKVTKEEKYVAYFFNGKWHYDNDSEVLKDCTVSFKREKGSMIQYYQNFTIAKKENGNYQTLDLSEKEFVDDILKCNIEAGEYRVILTNRQPSEMNIVDVEFYTFKNGDNLQINLKKLENKHSDEIVKIKDINLINYQKQDTTLFNELSCDSTNLFCYLDLKAEPTEHLLNEIIELKEYFRKCDKNLILIVKSLDDIGDMTLNKAIKEVENLKLYENKDFDIDYLMKDFKLKDKNLPLVVISKGYDGIYAFSGYQVGIGEMILKCL